MPLRVRPQAAGREALVDPAAHGQRVVEDRGVLVLAAPRHARCRRRSPAAPRAAPGCRAPARRTAPAARRRRATASSISRRISASTTTEWIAREVQRRRPRAMQRDDRRPQPARRGDELVRRRRAGDRAPAGETTIRVSRGDQVGVLHDAEHLAGRRQHGEVADAAIEHVQPHLAAQPVGRAPCRPAPSSPPRRARRRSSPPATTRVRRSRSVRIPSDRRRGRRRPRWRPRRSSAAPPRGCCVCGGQTTSGLRMSAATGWCAGAARPLARRPRRREAPAVQQRARDELQRLGPAEQPAGDVGRDAVADRVLARRAPVKPVGRPGEHRGVPEELADAEEVEHAPVQWTSSTAPLRTTRRCPTGSAPWEKTVVPAGVHARPRRRPATRWTSASSSASNGGWWRRKSATSAAVGAVSRSPEPRSTAGPSGRPGSACRRTSRRSSSSLCTG